MRLLVAALPFLLAVGAKPAYYPREPSSNDGNNDGSVHHGIDYGADDNTTLQDGLWRRVRIPGQCGGSPPTASQLFLVGDASLVRGCYSQTGVIDRWLNEARLLQNAVETVYGGYRNNKYFAALIYEFFGIKFNVDLAAGTYAVNPASRRQWSGLGNRIAGVTKFLDGGGLKNNRKPAEAPRIFCSGDAGQNVGWDSVAKNERGEDIPIKDPTTGNVLQYLTRRKAFSRAAAQATEIFWFPSFSGYGRSKRDNYHPGLLCGDPQNSLVYAMTSKLSYDIFLMGKDETDLELGKANRHILFCPMTFTPPAGYPHALDTLQEAVSSSNYPSGNNAKLPLDRIMTKSATLFHELYHLTDNGDTGDPYYLLEDILKAAKDGHIDTVDNPESFTVFAMACYVYLNPPDGTEAAYYLDGLPIRPADAPF